MDLHGNRRFFRAGLINSKFFFSSLLTGQLGLFFENNMQRSRPLTFLKRHLLPKQNVGVFPRSFTSMNGSEQGTGLIC